MPKSQLPMRSLAMRSQVDRIVVARNAFCGCVNQRNAMNSTLIGLRVAGTIFGLVCLAQLSRLLTHSDVIIAGRHVPLWPSVIAMLVTGALCGWLWKLS